MLEAASSRRLRLKLDSSVSFEISRCIVDGMFDRLANSLYEAAMPVYLSGEDNRQTIIIIKVRYIWASLNLTWPPITCY